MARVLTWITLLLIIVGLAFSGYLTIGYFGGTCPIAGGCAILLGLPACLYGFVLYLLALIGFLLAWKGRSLKLLLVFSLIGVLYAAGVLATDAMAGRSLTTCGMGFVVFLLIFLFTLVRWRQGGAPAAAPAPAPAAAPAPAQ